jgi:hypothetical protein
LKKLFACSAAVAALAVPVALAVPGAHAAPGTARSLAPATASPTAAPSCHHSPPASAPRQLLSQASPGGEVLGNQVAARIDAVIKKHEALDATARPISGLPLGLDQGIVGVAGDAYAGLAVVVDTSRVDAAALLNEIRSALPSHLAGAVEVEPSCRRATALAAAWRAVNRSFSGVGAPDSGAFDLDPTTETIEVLLGTANAAVASGVEALAAPGLIQARGDAGLSRGSRLADTPTPGHWGGARIEHTSATKITSCTAGFTVKRRSTGTRASLTAGHCGSNGDSFSSGQYSYGTMAGEANFPDYDQALLIGSTYAPSIWTDGPGDIEDVRVVKSAADPAVGQSICASGSFSKSLCELTVKSTSSTYCDHLGCTTYLLKADKGTSIVMREGDSGGPFYTKPAADSATVRGIVIAGSDCPNGDNCTGYVWGERYLSIAGHLGVDAVIG